MSAAASTPVPAVLQPFVTQTTILLRTRKRDGTFVGTPVNIAVHGDHAYVRTYTTSGKSKRLRNFSEVEFCPSTLRGKPTGEMVYAQARLLSGDEAQAAAQLIAAKHRILHGVMVPLVHRLRRTPTLHYEISDVRAAAE